MLQPMLTEQDILIDVSQRLAKLHIPFMLTGSMALNFYAQPRMTRDIDFIVDYRTDDAARLVAAFEGDYYVSEDAVRSAVINNTQFNLIHLESVIKVDCIVRKRSEHAREEFDRRQPLTVRDTETFIARKEDLILAKLAWAKKSDSQLQLHDVASLLSTGVDRSYLEAWAAKMGLDAILRKAGYE